MMKGPSKGLRRAVVAGAGLAALGPGLGHAEAKPHHFEPTKHEFRMGHEERRETASDFATPEEIGREKFRIGLEHAKKAGQDKVEKGIEERTLHLLKKVERGELTQKEAQEIASRINAELKEIDPSGQTRIVSGPELKKMGLVEDAASIPMGLWSLIMGAAKNLNNHYVLVPLTELIILYSYLQVARNARRRGFFKGIIENDPNRAHLGDIRGLSKIEQFGVLPLMGLYFANHYTAGIILGLIANPAIRAKVAGLIRDFNNRGGKGRGGFSSPGTPDPRNPDKRVLNTGRPVAGLKDNSGRSPTRRSAAPRTDSREGLGDKAARFIYSGDKEEPTAADLRDDWHDRVANTIDRMTGFKPGNKRRGRS
ncbi:MAG: hypothetical protein PHH82_01840 [Candidatus ainarchaeum sp.]|nr:hypothetical protein [Candidatus ainarchaeum sp.]